MRVHGVALRCVSPAARADHGDTPPRAAPPRTSPRAPGPATGDRDVPTASGRELRSGLCRHQQLQPGDPWATRVSHTDPTVTVARTPSSTRRLGVTDGLARSRLASGGSVRAGNCPHCVCFEDTNSRANKITARGHGQGCPGLGRRGLQKRSTGRPPRVGPQHGRGVSARWGHMDVGVSGRGTHGHGGSRGGGGGGPQEAEGPALSVAAQRGVPSRAEETCA